MSEHSSPKVPESKRNGSETESTAKALLKWFGRKVIENWPFKLLALLIAVVLWAALIAQDPDITREKTFTDVSVSTTGSETMKRNGFIVVSDLTEALRDVTITADVPQLQYNNATASAYNARVDLSRISETGKQSIKISTTNSSTYGSVVSVTPDTIEIEVEEYVTRSRIPVTLTTTGTAPDGYYATSPTADPSRIAVSGPASIVNNIARAEAVLDLSNLPSFEGTVRTAVRFILYSYDGVPIESSLVETTSESVLIDSITAEQMMYSKRELSLSDFALTTGEPASGYEVRSVTMTPTSVIAAGKADNLALIDKLYTDDSVVLTGATESFTKTVKIHKPSEIAYLSTDSVTLSVEIAKIESERTFSSLKITMTGLGDGLRYSYTVDKASVTVSGTQLWLDSLRASNVSVTCDLTGLEPGTYDLPLTATVANAEDGCTAVCNPGTITVTILKK